MILNLNLIERIVLLNSIPKSGKLNEMRDYINLKNLVSVSSVEINDVELDIKDDNSFTCLPHALDKKPYHLDESIVTTVKNIIKKWDNESQINSYNIEICNQLSDE